jgi:hypothetical protein
VEFPEINIAAAHPAIYKASLFDPRRALRKSPVETLAVVTII